MTPLLMEPQPTGNISFDESMTDIRRKINVCSKFYPLFSVQSFSGVKIRISSCEPKEHFKLLREQKRQSHDANKINLLLTQIRDLQGQLVRGVPQTTGFLQVVDPEFDGEEDGEDAHYECMFCASAVFKSFPW